MCVVERVVKSDYGMRYGITLVRHLDPPFSTTRRTATKHQSREQSEVYYLLIFLVC